MKRILIVTLLALSIAGIGEGAEILLKSGNVIIGKILSRTPSQVIVEVDSNGIKLPYPIPMVKVQMITETATLFKSTSRSAGAAPEKLEPVTKPKEGGADEIEFVDVYPKDKKKTEEAGKEGKEEEKLNPVIAKQITQLIGGMDTTDEKQRQAIEGKISSFGKDAVPLLVEALLKTKKRRQTLGILAVLRKLRDKRATRALIEKLNGTKIDELVMDIAWRTLKTVTGKSIDFDNTKSLSIRNSQIAKWKTWWESVKESYPEQIGFEEKEEKETSKKESKENVEAKTPVAKPVPAEKTAKDELDW